MLRYFAAPADNSKSKAQFVKLRANNVRLFTERSENWGVYLLHLPLHKDRISYNLSFLKVLKDSTKIAIVSSLWTTHSMYKHFFISNASVLLLCSTTPSSAAFTKGKCMTWAAPLCSTAIKGMPEGRESALFTHVCCMYERKVSHLRRQKRDGECTALRIFDMLYVQHQS